MYLTKRRFRRTKKRVHKHKKTAKKLQTGGGLFNDVSLVDFIQTGYLEAKYALEKYPADRWPDAFKIKQPDVDFYAKFIDKTDEIPQKLQNIYTHNIAKIKEAYKIFYERQNPKPRVKVMDYEKPIKSLRVKQMIQSVDYFDLHTTAEILSPTDFNEVIDYISSIQIYKKSFGVKTGINEKYLLFGQCFDLFVKSRNELKGMIPATTNELEKKNLILGIKDLIKSLKSAIIKDAEDASLKFGSLGFIAKRAAMTVANAAASIYKEETTLYENYHTRLKKIIELCRGLKSTDSLVNTLLTVPIAAFQTESNSIVTIVYKPPVSAAAAAKPAVTAPAPVAKQQPTVAATTNGSSTSTSSKASSP